MSLPSRCRVFSWTFLLHIITVGVVSLAVYFEIVPICVASCLLVLPSLWFSLLPVFFSCLTRPELHPLISVCVYSPCSPPCLRQFVPCSPLMPPCVFNPCYLQCLSVGMFLIFVPSVFLLICTLLLFALCLSSLIATLSFCPLWLVLVDFLFFCIIQLWLLKLAFCSLILPPVFLVLTLFVEP